MPDRDPRGVVRRRREAAARVHIVGKAQNTAATDGAVTTRQVADIYLPQSELDGIWNAEYRPAAASSTVTATIARP
jgi:hypothetical protein